MKKQVLRATMMTIVAIESANAANCYQQLADESHCATITNPAQNIAHCESYMFPYPLCYSNASGMYKKFNLCSKCADGYILTLNPDFAAMGCSDGDGGVYVCQPCSVAKSCNPNDDARVDYDPDGYRNSWVGYQTNSWTECNTNTCKWERRAKFRCAAGYYGNSSAITENIIDGYVMGMNGCTQCPYSSHATLGTSDAGENETIEGCYLVESEGWDFTGSYKIIPPNTRCYYEND